MMLGIHLSNRQWRNPQLSDDDKRLLLLMSPGVTAVKTFSYHREDTWEWVQQTLKPRLWVCRLNDLGDFDNLRSLYAVGYRFVLEIGNEPNHPNEPWGGSIDAFAVWYDQAQTIAAEDMPECPLCFPGLSPSFSAVTWWASPMLAPFIERADYLGVHSYYTQRELMCDEREGVSWLKAQRLFPSKPLLLTEFCCTAGESGRARERADLAREYVDYARWLRSQANIQGIFYFILGSDDPHWSTVGETFDEQMAAAIGQRGNMDPETQAKIDQLLQQNTLITEGFKRLRKGRFTGADGLDGIIVALQGGNPLDFFPSWPPKNL